MILVLHTSRGVVIPAATPPAKLPHTAASIAGRSRTSPDAVRERASTSLRCSYIGNWRHVKGILGSSDEGYGFGSYLASDGTPKSTIETLDPSRVPDGLGDAETARPLDARL